MLAPVSLIQLTRVNFAVEENGTILRNPVELVLNIYTPFKIAKKTKRCCITTGVMHFNLTGDILMGFLCFVD